MARKYKIRNHINQILDFEGNSMNDVIDFEVHKKKVQNNSLRLKGISPKTENQQKVFDSYYSGKQQLLLGCAGTGKSFLSLYLMLSDLLAKDSEYEKLIIIRSAVQSRDQGFMPGSAKEKAKYFESPYSSICTELFGRGDSYEILKNKNQVSFETTSFLRGMTFNNALIFVDEVQSMTLHEIDTIVSRTGTNSRLIISGDLKQNDLYNKKYESSGLNDAINIIRRMQEFDIIEFRPDDIVRSGLVRSWIMSKDKLGL